MVVWQLMHAFVLCTPIANRTSSTNKEISLPVALVLERVLSEWHSRQELLGFFSAAKAGSPTRRMMRLAPTSRALKKVLELGVFMLLDRFIDRLKPAGVTIIACSIYFI